MRIKLSTRAMRAMAGIVAMVAVAGCGKTEARTITGPDGQSITALRGTEFTIRLQTVGAGEFASPPAISSDAVRFLDVRQADFNVPGGPTQDFRFRAVAPGTVTIEFVHTGSSRRVVDTVEVR